MDEKVQALRELGVRSVPTVLADLEHLAERAKEGEPVPQPRVTLHLRSGRDVSGIVLASGSDRRGAALLLHRTGDTGRRPGSDVLYVDPAMIEAVTVHESADVARQLAALEPPPSRLDLKRKAADTGSVLSKELGGPIVIELAWNSLPESGEPLRGVAHLLAATAAALRQVAMDGFGRVELQRLVRTVRLAPAEEGLTTPGVRRRGDTLVVTASPSAPPAADTLRSLIEASL
jgi:hypothetical protein